MNTPDYSRKISAIMSADVAGYSRLMGGLKKAGVELDRLVVGGKAFGKAFAHC